MIINLQKTVYELCKSDPKIIEILWKLGFKDITWPGILESAGRFMTIYKGAAMKKIDIENIKNEFIKEGYEIIE